MNNLFTYSVCPKMCKVRTDLRKMSFMLVLVWKDLLVPKRGSGEGPPTVQKTPNKRDGGVQELPPTTDSLHVPSRFTPLQR